MRRLVVSGLMGLVSVAALGGVSQATAANLTLVTFQSPSKNIGCAMLKSGVRCDIGNHTWVAPPKPASCDFDFGNGLEMSKRGPARFNCASDTVLHQGKVLRYGKSKRVGRFSCTSRMDGVHCTNHSNGHGFFLSSKHARIF